MGQQTEKRGAGEGRRDRRPRQARRRQDRRYAVAPARRRTQQLVDGQALSAGARRSRCSAKERKDDVKLGAALHQAASRRTRRSRVVHNAENHEMVIWGQGEMHLRVAAERLAGRYGVAGRRPGAPTVPYRETIKQADQHPRPPQEAVRRPRPVRRRGAGDQAAAARLRLQVRGEDHRRRRAAQLHPVGRGGRRDASQARARSASRWSIVAVTLTDGSYHTVDSSDMAFRTAGRIGMREGMPQCQPVLLEPVHQGRDRRARPTRPRKINAILSQRRGQILGFDARAGWEGWDMVEAHDAASRNRRPHHRAALGHRRRRHLHASSSTTWPN